MTTHGSTHPTQQARYLGKSHARSAPEGTSSCISHPWPKFESTVNKQELARASHHVRNYAWDDSAIPRISDAIAVAASGLKSTASPLIGFMEEPNRSFQRSHSEGATVTCDQREAAAALDSHYEPETTRRTTKRPRTTDSTDSTPSLPPVSPIEVAAAAAVAANLTMAADDGAAAADCCGMDHEDRDDDVDAVNPCPICLANEDDAGNHAMCFECGQMFCGCCNHSGKMPGCCPMCRADNHPAPEVRAERLGRLLARSAGRHTSWAQCALGAMVFAGFGVEKDEAKAVQLLRLAADAGLVWAQHNLGNIYLNSADSGPVRRNYAEAARFYAKAAEQGDQQSRFSLAMMYLTGKGFTSPNGPPNHTVNSAACS